jgi:uncharacterized pyridoxal phosphate-containing UPF0001 family protein
VALFGENRVQRRWEDGRGRAGATWHLVGHLQNKAKQATGAFELIHGLDDRD